MLKLPSLPLVDVGHIQHASVYAAKARRVNIQIPLRGLLKSESRLTCIEVCYKLISSAVKSRGG